MKKAFILLLIIPILGIAQTKKTSIKTRSTVSKLGTTLDIASALKEALNKGIADQVSKLTKEDGFYKNDLVKISMPEELARVDKTLRKIGLGSLTDEGIKSLNRAAESAVKEATPVFIAAIKNIQIADAKSILMGNESAATTYLEQSTSKELYEKFMPIVAQSIGSVGADVVWNGLIQKYNTLPLVSKVNPDLNDYVTHKALEGVFKMIAVEEKNIRTNLNSRTTAALKKVFALQDIIK